MLASLNKHNFSAKKKPSILDHLKFAVGVTVVLMHPRTHIVGIISLQHSRSAPCDVTKGTYCLHLPGWCQQPQARVGSALFIAFQTQPRGFAVQL